MTCMSTILNISVCSHIGKHRSDLSSNNALIYCPLRILLLSSLIEYKINIYLLNLVHSHSIAINPIISLLMVIF